MTVKNSDRLHLVVKGRVQGVGFRYYVQDHAQRLALTGWVRNLWDGQVEVVAEGNMAQLEQLLAIVQRGPSSARVSAVDIRWSSATGEFGGFHVRQTA